MCLETSERVHLKNSNLTKLWYNCVNYLIKNIQYVVLILDENIGLCIANRDNYIATIMNQHFGHTHIYEIISKE